jgi:hypothetical protein
MFTSTDFFEAFAYECEDTAVSFGASATSKKVANFGRNNQIFDTFKTIARDLRRGAELARLGDYKLVWDTACCVRGDVRGMMEQPLHSWMTDAEHREFETIRIGRLMTNANQITRALNNAMIGATSFFHPNPNYPESSNNDYGFPDESIVTSYESNLRSYPDLLFWKLPEPFPEYAVDKSISCKTGDEVPWTGVWYPGTGLDGHSLTFAVKGLRMQPVYRVIKTIEELKREGGGVFVTRPETVAVATTWHPVIPTGRHIDPHADQRAKAGQPCPKAGLWQPLEPGAGPRLYVEGETMADLKSAYGFTVWTWVADR